MSRRAIPSHLRAWLSTELETWCGQGILSEEQSSRILELYETPRELAERKRSTAWLALVSLAGLMVGLALLLLIGYNWNALPDLLKLALLFGALIGAHGGAFYLRFRRGAKLGSEVLFFLGCFFYGIAIWQVAHVFHIQSHYPNGVWIWAVGTLLVALCLDTPLLHFLAAALAAIWVGVEILGDHGLERWLFGRWFALPNGALSLPLLAAAGLVWAYRRGSLLTVSLYALLLAWWAVLQPVGWHGGEETVYFMGAVGGLYLLVAQARRQGSPLAIPFRLFGVLLSAGVLVPLSFFDFNKEMLHEHVWQGHFYWGRFLAGPVLLGLAAAMVMMIPICKRLLFGQRAPLLLQWKETVRNQWLPLGIVVVMAGFSLENALLGGDAGAWSIAVVLPTVVANAAMVGLAVWLMRLGLREDRGLPFAAGVLYFVLWSVLRYIDLFADFGGMLGASLMFFLCGAGLFGVALFWRRRKEVSHG